MKWFVSLLYMASGVLGASPADVARAESLVGVEGKAMLANWLPHGGSGEGTAAGLEWADGAAEWLATGPLGEGRLALTVTPLARLREGRWATSGLRLMDSPRRFWLLGLTEDPDGRRHVDLIEMLDGKWQAQNEPPTRLERSESAELAWEWGQPVRLEIELTGGQLTARAKVAAAANWAWTCDVALPAAVAAVRSGRLGIHAQDARARFEQVEVQGSLAATRVHGAGAVVMADDGSAAGEALAGLAAGAGYTALRQAPATLALDPRRDGLLLAERLNRLPVSAMRAIADWVAAGGDVYAGGGEPFADPLYQAADGHWATRTETLASTAPTRPGIAFPRADAISQATNAGPLAKLSTVAGPDGADTALRAEVSDLTGWHTFALPSFESSPFADGETLTVVWVRGTDGQTSTIEWNELDGSRWIANVPLTSRWTRHVLEPRDFVAWPVVDNPREGSRLDPAATRRLSFGPAIGFGSAHQGAAWFELAPVQTAAALSQLDDFEPPIIETLSPWYKQFIDQNGLRQPILRSRGLTSAPEPDGRHQVMANGLSRYVTRQGAVIWWRPEGTDSPLVADDATALRLGGAGLWLLNAGPESVIVEPGQPLHLGARVLNGGGSDSTAQITFEAAGATVARNVTIAAGGQVSVWAEMPASHALGEQPVVIRLADAQAERDVQATAVRVTSREPTAGPDRRVRAVGDRFVVNGQPVFLYGVNYWPRNVPGLEPDRYNASWLDPLNYDPQVVEEDLALMERLGVNLVAVQYANPAFGAPMRDFLERCRNHGVWVNAYVGSANDLRSDAERDRKLFEAAGLAGNDTVAMLDLAWEPRLGDHGQRRRFDDEWRAWLVEQYGSTQRAEQQWGITAPREDGEVSNPTDAQLDQDGPQRVMVAAYRRFADDLISRHYGRVARSLRRLDPEVLLSVRTGYGGTGQAYPNRVMAYDLTAGVAHLDLTSPEGYGMPPDWEKALDTGLITAWGRAVSGGKPVYWSEFGASLGPRGGSDETRATQKDVWTSTLELCSQDRAAGSAGWWWPGGWRVNEKSDFGVVEPDGRPRPPLLASVAMAPIALAAMAGEPHDPVVIDVDRDADARGLHGLWERHRAEFARLTREGHSVQLRVAPEGLSTRNMPMVQIGNLPWQTGTPLKWANAEVAGLTWVAAGQPQEGENWQRWTAGQQPAQVTVRLLNTGWATWDGCRLQLAGTIKELPTTPAFGSCEVTVDVPAGGPGWRTARVTTAEGQPFGETLSLGLR